MSQFGLVRDISGLNTFLRMPSQNIYATTLASGVEQTFTVPLSENGQRWDVIFSYELGADVYVAINNTATLPGASFAQTNSEHNPVGYRLKSGDVIHFITSSTSSTVTITLATEGQFGV